MTNAAASRLSSASVSPSGFQLYCLSLEGGGDSLTDATVDVILVHGLTGDPMATWGISSEAGGSCTGWPVDLARELQGKVRLWTAGYKAPLIASSSDPQSLEQQGRDALSGLAQANIGQHKILFVAHSLGGILVKSILAAASTSSDEREKEVLERTHGVVFVGTPHAGSELTALRRAVPLVAKTVASGFGWIAATLLGATILASTIASVSVFGFHWSTTVGGLIAAVLVPLLALILGALARPSEHVLNLDPENPALFDLTHHYRRILGLRPFATRAFFEQQRMWLLFKAVPRASADPGVTDCTPIGLPANHVTMCKGAHAAPIATALRELVGAARRGLDKPVFERYLNPRAFEESQRAKIKGLLLMPDGSYVKRFADVEGDRREGERILREHLRYQFSHVDRPTAVELELAEVSGFDLDTFVWCMWHERNMVRSQRKLRLNAIAAMERWEAEFQAPRPSLINFYRPMRTMEHNLLGDLAERSLHSEHEALLEMVVRARAVLDAQCPAVTGTIGTRVWALDGDAGTRRMLLRMQCALEISDASEAFFSREACAHHEDAAKHRADLERWRRQYCAALDAFNTVLGLSKPTSAGSAEAGGAGV